MLDSIVQILRGIAQFLGLLSHPELKKVEDVMPEKSASEAALEELEGGGSGPSPKS